MTVSRRSMLAASAGGLAFAAGPVRAQATAPTVLITGSNRGIGLQFAKDYAAKGWNVIATTRNPDDAPELKKLAAANKKVTVERLDVTKPAEIDALAAKYKGKPIDILINNAGIIGDFMKPKPQAFGTLDHGQADEFMHVNALGPLKVTEAFYDSVKISGQKKIAAITSLAGSRGVDYGGVPGGYWYKLSKAALNAAMANVALDAKKDGVVVVLLSPGQVRVEKIANAPIPNLIDPPESIRGMMKVLDGVTLADAGTIIRYTGEKQPF
jgi:NAD(P)-dependent dehydrogenase (short-subunit alcohol dehydrogenase family)